VIVHPVTWLDIEDKWPYSLFTDRALIRRPRSLGLRLELPDAEAEIVLYEHGWADVDVARWPEVDVHTEGIELETAEEFGPLLDRVLARMTGPMRKRVVAWATVRRFLNRYVLRPRGPL
jgi:hypothetical protein